MRRPLFSRPIARIPPTVLAATIGAYLFVTASVIWDVGVRDWPTVRHLSREGRALALVMVPLLGGLARMVAGNPRSQPVYARWLAATPWQPGRRLPLGPLVWAFEDVVALIPLALLARFDAGLPWFTPVVPYVVARAVGAISSAVKSERHAAAAGVAFALPVLLLVWPWDVPLMIALVVVAVADTVAVRAALSTFPWEPTDPSVRPRQWPIGTITWPTNLIGPVPLPRPLSLRRCLVLPVLPAWWVWAALHAAYWLNDWATVTDWYTAMELIGGAFVLWRLAIYCVRFRPPVNLRGRLWTGRFILPGYDRVLVAPAVAMGLAMVVPRLVHTIGGSPAEALAALCVAVGTPLLLGGPTLRNWHLTGHHRIIRGLPPTANTQAARRQSSLVRN